MRKCLCRKCAPMQEINENPYACTGENLDGTPCMRRVPLERYGSYSDCLDVCVGLVIHGAEVKSISQLAKSKSERRCDLCKGPKGVWPGLRQYCETASAAPAPGDAVGPGGG